MGYESRDDMRVQGRDESPGRSHPFWWILGLIGLIMVFGFLRRGTGPRSPSAESDRLRVSAGPVQECTIDFHLDDNGADGVFPFLRKFFKRHGYNTMMHETADGLQLSSTFSLQDEAMQVIRSVQYQRNRRVEGDVPPGHQLIFYTMKLDRSAEDTGSEQYRLMTEELRLSLDDELPGVVTRYDSTPTAMNDDEW